MSAPQSSSSGTKDILALDPCPFCGSQIEHITSWAKSFDPPRLFHEWHHVDDNEDACPIRRRSKIVDATNESLERQAAVIQRWNVRLSPTPQIAGGVREALENIAQLTNVGCGDILSLQDALRDIHELATAALSPQAQVGCTCPFDGCAPCLACAARSDDVAQPASVAETLSLAIAWGNAAGQATMNCNLRPERDAAWERLAEAVEGLAQGQHDAIYLRGWNEAIEAAGELLGSAPADKIWTLIDASPPAALPAGEDVRRWPRIFNVKRSAFNAWHGDISFSHCPTDEELKALEILLRDDHQPAPSVSSTEGNSRG